MQNNHFRLTGQSIWELAGLVLVVLFALSQQAPILAQVLPPTAMESKIRVLLKAEEFKDQRREIVAMGSPALRPLLKILEENSDEEMAVRVLSVLRDISGDKRAFLPTTTILTKASNPAVETAAILALGEIGTPEQAKVLEEIVAGVQRREASRINAARALARIGPKQSIATVEAVLQNERGRSGNRGLIDALQLSLRGLRDRHP